MSTYAPKHLAVTPREPRFGYRPGLDGLRGISVIAVLCFHQGFSWARGGFLGVSAFFTLSGFLITAILLTRDTDARTGQRMKIFFTRRARRLLPAAWVAVAFTLLLAANGAFVSGGTGGDAIAALANVANWRLITEGSAYTELFEAPSAFQQFWSLAIEEQFYLVLPIMLLLVARRFRADRAFVGLGVVALASTVTMALLGPGDRAYYGSDTRSAELIVGVMAAVVAFSPRLRASRAFRRNIGRAGMVGVVIYGVMWSTLDVDSAVLYNGGFLLHALATVAVIAAMFVRGPVNDILSLRPLVWIGRISYGVYLYHWPVFLWMTPDRTNLDGVPLFALRVAVTLAGSIASYHLIEMPVRERRTVVWRSPLPIGAAALTALLTVALVAPVDPATSASADLDRAQQEFDAALTGASDTGPVEIAETPVGIDRPVRIGMFGDSTALMTAIGLLDYSDRHPDRIASVTGDAPFGCALARQGEVALQPPTYTPGPPSCVAREETWAAALATQPIDVAVIQFGPWEVSDHLLNPDDDPRAPGDYYFDTYLRGEMRLATEFFTDRGIPVIWLTSPYVEIGVDQQPPPSPPYPASDRVRMDRYNELLDDVVAEHRQLGHDVITLDLGRYVNDHAQGGPGGPIRPDGVHFTIESSAAVAAEFLGPHLVDTARALMR